MRAARPDHAGSDRSEHENAFQALPEHEHRDIEKGDSRTGIRLERIGSTVPSHSLPDEHGHNAESGERSADEKRPAGFPGHVLANEFITLGLSGLLFGCFFLAAACGGGYDRARVLVCSGCEFAAAEYLPKCETEGRLP